MTKATCRRFILAYSPREIRAHPSWQRKYDSKWQAWKQNREVRELTSLATSRNQREQTGSSWGFLLCLLPVTYFSNKAAPRKGFTASPNSTTTWSCSDTHICEGHFCLNCHTQYAIIASGFFPQYVLRFICIVACVSILFLSIAE